MYKYLVILGIWKSSLGLKGKNLHYTLMVNLILKNFSYETTEGLTRMQDIRHNVSYVEPSGKTIVGLEYLMIKIVSIK